MLPDAKIYAEGTADEPITFTTAQDLTGYDSDTNIAALQGLWGGLIVMGNAQVHGGSREVEGIEGYHYGGNDNDDDSGILKYVRGRAGGRAGGRA